LPATGCRRSREGDETLEFGAGTAGTGYLLLAAHQLLEVGAATATVVVVDRHGKRFAEGQRRVKGTNRSSDH
jgi:malic enzyme